MFFEKARRIKQLEADNDHLFRKYIQSTDGSTAMKRENKNMKGMINTQFPLVDPDHFARRAEQAISAIEQSLRMFDKNCTPEGAVEAMRALGYQLQVMQEEESHRKMKKKYPKEVAEYEALVEEKRLWGDI